MTAKPGSEKPACKRQEYTVTEIAPSSRGTITLPQPICSPSFVTAKLIFAWASLSLTMQEFVTARPSGVEPVCGRQKQEYAVKGDGLIKQERPTTGTVGCDNPSAAFHQSHRS